MSQPTVPQRFDDDRTAGATLTRPQDAALARLLYAVRQTSGMAVLCGPGGTGVTTLLTQLAMHFQGVRESVVCLSGRQIVRDPMPETLQGVRSAGMSANLRAVFLDDAHLAEAELLADLVASLRSKCEGVGIVLAGRGRLLTLLAREQELQQQVLLRAVLPPWTPAETEAYVNSRLTASGVGGWAAAVPFTVHEIAAGIPRLIQRLVDSVLLVALTHPDHKFSCDDVEQMYERLSPAAA